VKLDCSLVSQVGSVPEMETLVRSLIGTAHSFNLDILAEGVERAEQAQFLMSHDCKKVQGFLFGKPVSATEIAAIIAKDTRNALGGESELSKSSIAAA
jgi:EAL domain-containing protein (putative c-di-GMP-specific phosphodiesterase class I)